MQEIHGLLAGVPSVKQLMVLHDEAEGAAKERLKRLQQLMPSCGIAVSAGDVVADDERNLTHRASTVSGMSGSALQWLHDPDLMCGVHLQTSGAAISFPWWMS